MFIKGVSVHHIVNGAANDTSKFHVLSTFAKSDHTAENRREATLWSTEDSGQIENLQLVESSSRPINTEIYCVSVPNDVLEAKELAI